MKYITDNKRTSLPCPWGLVLLVSHSCYWNDDKTGSKAHQITLTVRYTFTYDLAHQHRKRVSSHTLRWNLQCVPCHIQVKTRCSSHHADLPFVHDFFKRPGLPTKKKTAQRGECGLTRERESRQLSQASLSALSRSRWAPRILSRATSVKKSSIAHFKRVKPGKVNPSIKITHMKEQGSTFAGRDLPCLGTPLFFSLSLSGESFIWPHWQSVTGSTRQLKKKKASG